MMLHLLISFAVLITIIVLLVSCIQPVMAPLRHPACRLVKYREGERNLFIAVERGGVLHMHTMMLIEPTRSQTFARCDLPRGPVNLVGTASTVIFPPTPYPPTTLTPTSPAARAKALPSGFSDPVRVDCLA